MEEIYRKRATTGAEVAQGLLAYPGSSRVPAVGLQMYIVRDFLTPEECAGLIERIDGNRVPSAVLGTHSDPDFRSSESCYMDPGDPLVQSVEQKINDLMGLVPDHGETIQGQRYAAGQQFKPHYDFFFTHLPYWEQERRAGGQRTWTAMAFLNKPDAGGQTFFLRAGVKITPRAGDLLVWNNLDERGAPNRSSIHQGMPVEAGTKYIITKWYRERPWVASLTRPH